MLPATPVERIALPAPPPDPTPIPFPFAAALAPVVVSLGIWAVTGSVFSLLFAALGPVVAVGGVLDGRRGRRRASRRERVRQLAALARVHDRLRVAQQRERERLDASALAIAAALETRRVLEQWSRDPGAGGAPLVLAARVGRGDAASPVELDGESADERPEVSMRRRQWKRRGSRSGGDAPAERAARMRADAERLAAAPLLVDLADGVGVVGPPVLARAVVRALMIQALGRCSPATVEVMAPLGEGWLAAAPHRRSWHERSTFELRWTDAAAGARAGAGAGGGASIVLAWAEHERGLPPGVGTVIDLADPSTRRLEAVAWGSAQDHARDLARIALEHGIGSAASQPPERVDLADLLAEAPVGSAGSLSAPVGRDGRGILHLDLVRDGPHAVVAGTTGAGKSELLVSWVVSMARRHPPDRVTFLLVDFKGGSAFAPLRDLPHVVGIVSDLDARRSTRAIESLRAELRRRERLLAELGVRSIEEIEATDGGGRGLARLVIVVDEFAAVVSGRPELHEVFADLAARGRSLGLHLVLCTQRPAGVVRDGVLANITLRISLRVLDRGDSVAMTGTDAAAVLPVAVRGRAVVADGAGPPREVQMAIAGAADVDGARLAAAGARRPAPVWCEPLPARIELASLERDRDWPRARGIPFGRADEPSEQRQPLAVHDPQRHGHLLVLGAARSGRTTALAAFAADPRCRVLPADVADAWTVIDRLLAATTATTAAIAGTTGTSGGSSAGVPTRVLLVDDLDLLVDRLEPELRHDFVERLARLARESRELGLVVTAQRLGPALQRLAGLFDSRLLLRQSGREEHVLAGGDGGDFDPRRTAGAGTWHPGGGSRVVVQVAVARDALPVAAVPTLPRVEIRPDVPLAIVSGRPRDLEALLVASTSAPRVIRVGQRSPASVPPAALPSPAASVVLLGDPEEWQAEWALLSSIRRASPMVFHACTPTDVRAVARIREPPPPLGTRAGECWLVDGERVVRAVLG